MAGEEISGSDYVISEKIQNSFLDQEKNENSWLKDSKEIKLDEEELNKKNQNKELMSDIEIVNDIAITVDDTTLRSITVRSMVIGVVSF